MPYLPEALDSIMNQTLTNLEILCINDGSTDETAEVLEQYATRDKRFRVVHNETNLKLITTLNKGVQLSKGEYFARMDADDVSLPNRLEIQFDFLQNNPNVNIVSTSKYIITEKNEVLAENITRNSLPETSLFVSFLYRPIGHAELMGKTSIFKENPFKQESHTVHTEDYELWTRLLRKGYKLANLKDPLYKFRINSQSVSHKFTNVQDDNFVSSANIHFNTYFNDTLDLEITRVVANRLLPSTSLKDWLKGVKTIKQLKKHFSGLSETIEARKEIKTIYQTHILDVCFQSLKRCSVKVKFFAFLELLKNLNIFINPPVRKYIKEKIIIRK